MFCPVCQTVYFGGYGVSVHLFPFRAAGVGSADNVKLSPPSLMILHLFVEK